MAAAAYLLAGRFLRPTMSLVVYIFTVYGMAAVVLEGEDPLLLDFEDPKETLQKLERLRDEIARRSSPQAEEPRQTGSAENSQETIRR